MPQAIPESSCFSSDHRVNVLLDECLVQADSLVATIRASVNRGEPARDVVTSLDALVKAIIRLAPTDPTSITEATGRRIRDLLAAMQLARQEGAAWLQDVALPELESVTRQQNGLNIYLQRSQPP
jgi:hypothetical protein